MIGLAKLYSNSLLIMGLIEDIDINMIKISNRLIRNNCDDTELSLSIKEKGLLQPIIVRSIDLHYEIVAGARRYNVCKKLGWKKIICHIIEATEKEAFEIALIENIHRSHLDPISEAMAFKEYIVNYGWGGISELASKIGKSPAYVDKRLNLLELPREVIESVTKMEISPSAAEELLPIKDHESLVDVTDLVIKQKIPSKKIRLMVRNIKNENASYGYEFFPSNGYDCDINRGRDDTKKVFDKSITVLKITTQKLAMLISEVEDNWIVYELMMQHKNMVDKQIDLIIKQKKKYNY
jgi:ParB family chromosome partitioning protein